MSEKIVLFFSSFCFNLQGGPRPDTLANEETSSPSIINLNQLWQKHIKSNRVQVQKSIDIKISDVVVASLKWDIVGKLRGLIKS